MSLAITCNWSGPELVFLVLQAVLHDHEHSDIVTDIGAPV